MTTAPLVSLSGVQRQFGNDSGVAALTGVDLDIAEGEFVAIVGRSGSGKSTLLNILGLLDRPSAGEYRIRGVDVGSLSEAERDRVRGREIGFVFQDSAALAERSVASNVELPLVLHGAAHVERGRRSREVLDTVGLGHRADLTAKHLSGGERQRMAIARAIIHHPAILLVDEPTGSLDSLNARAVHELLRSLHAAGVTIVVVTHDAELANVADRRVSLSDGHIIADDSPSASMRRDGQVAATESRRASIVSRLGNGVLEAVRSLSERGGKTILSIAVIAMGTAGVVAGIGVADAADARVAAAFNAAASDEVRITPRGTATVDAESLRRVDALNGVVAAGLMSSAPAESLQVSRLPGRLGGATYQGSVLAVTTGTLTAFGIADADRYGPALTQPALARSCVLLGEKAAVALSIASSGPGNDIWIDGRPFTVCGVVTPDDTHEVVATSVIVSDALRESLGLTDTRSIVARTAPGMAPNIALAAPLALDAARPGDWLAQTTAALGSLRASVDASLAWLFFAMAAILLAVAAVATSSAQGSAVLARQREIGLRRALGTSRRGIGLLFFAEGLGAGFLGGLWGAALGVGALVTLSFVEQWPVPLSVLSIVIAFVVGTCTGAAGSAIPAVRASRLDPARALRG